jgi:murein DD-endopeptidase MepM/ murein hydrolase activator NlpD
VIRFLLAALLLLPCVAASAAVTLSGEPVQGGLVQGRAAPGATVTLDGTPVAVAPDGLFVLGFGRDAKPGAVLTVRAPDGRVETRALAVKQRRWRVSRVDGLPDRTVTPQPEDIERIAAERKLLVAARRQTAPDAHFRGGFAWPSRGRISGVYGSQRILNGEPRRPHLGVDIAAPSGTPVVAAADGVVSLVHEDMFFTGKTVLIDHGLGVGTTYVHLSAIAVKQGQRVRQGQRIGRIGQTGRATGPHLHWGLTWRGLRLDPALLVGPMPDPAPSE